jgi:hypothetical protein
MSTETVPKQSGFVTTLYGIMCRGRLLPSPIHPNNHNVPCVYGNLQDAEKDAEHWAFMSGKKHRAVAIEVDYKWKVKDRKPKGKT